MIVARKPIEPHRVQPREGALTGVMIDPLAVFERSFEVADAYENWLEAQADLFWALHAFSLTSLALFRSLLGKQPSADGASSHGNRRARALPRKQRRRG